MKNFRNITIEQLDEIETRVIQLAKFQKKEYIQNLNKARLDPDFPDFQGLANSFYYLLELVGYRN